MTSLLSTLNGFAFTSAKARATRDESDLEFQGVFAATAVLFAGGVAVILVALSQAL